MIFVLRVSTEYLWCTMHYYRKQKLLCVCACVCMGVNKWVSWENASTENVSKCYYYNERVHTQFQISSTIVYPWWFFLCVKPHFTCVSIFFLQKKLALSIYSLCLFAFSSVIVIIIVFFCIGLLSTAYLNTALIFGCLISMILNQIEVYS